MASARVAASLAVAASLGCGDGRGAGTAERPPVILVIIDTLRADHLGFDGHDLDTSPVLDGLAAASTVFEANSTQCNSTFPSITSIFTGLYPKTHRNYLAVSVDGQAVANERAHSLAQRLGEQGYETLAVVSHPWWREAPIDTAIGRGWDAFAPIPPAIEGPARRGEAGSALATTERVFDLLDARDPARPLFLWAHYFDPHTPYIPPPHHRDRFLRAHLEREGFGHLHDSLAALPLGERAAWIGARPEAEWRPLRLALGRALYDGEIADCDEQLGRLFDRLRADGLWDDALVVVMADHGENMDPGRASIDFTHGRLYEGVVRTPLVIKRPGQVAGSRVSALTQNIDVLPTIVELLDLPTGAATEGASLVPLLEDPGATVHAQVFVESSDKLERAVRTDDLKLIDPGDGNGPELYRWRDDVDEQSDLAAEAPAGVLGALAAELATFRPRQVLRLRALPDEEPYALDVDLALDKAHMSWLSGPLEPADDGRRLVGRVQVDSEPVELALALDREAYEGALGLARADGAPLWRRIVLGATPARESDAYPVWEPTGPPLDPEPRTVQHLTSPLDGTQAVHVLPGVPDALPTVTLHLMPGSGRLPTTRSLTARETLSLEGGRVRHVVGEAGKPLTVTWDGLPWPDSLGVDPRLGGRWVGPRRVLLGDPDGTVREVAPSRLTLMLPRTGALGVLLNDPPPDDLPAGSVALWMDTSGAAAEIDVSLLDEERLEELRALGYVK